MSIRFGHSSSDAHFVRCDFGWIEGREIFIHRIRMSLVNQTPELGRLILSLTCVFFVWFSVWVLVSPFYDDPCTFFPSFFCSNLLDFLAFFPDRKWAVQVPVTIGVIGLSLVLMFLGVTLRNA